MTDLSYKYNTLSWPGQLAGSVGRSIEQAFGHMVGEMDRDKTAVYLETDTFVM